MKNPNRIFLYFCIVLSYPLQAATVETKVLSQLKATSQAQVIVTLHDPVSVYRGAVSDKQHRELVAQAQASVLSANHLRSANHFKLKRQYSRLSWHYHSQGARYFAKSSPSRLYSTR